MAISAAMGPQGHPTALPGPSITSSLGLTQSAGAEHRGQGQLEVPALPQGSTPHIPKIKRWENSHPT